MSTTTTTTTTMESTEIGPSERNKQVRVQFVTQDDDLTVPEAPIMVPTSLRRYGLSEIVNHLLETEKPIPFDFLVNGEIIRVSLDEYLVSHGLSPENILTLEYTRSILPPSYLASFSHDDWVSSVSIESDKPSARILTGSYDGIVRIWDQSQNVERELVGHSRPVKDVKWVGPERIASAGMDQEIRLWKVPESISKNLAPTVLCGHKAAVENIAVNPKTQRMLSAGTDGAVGIWSTNAKENPLPSSEFESISHKRRRKSSAVGDVGKRRGPLIFNDEQHTAPVSDVIFDPRDGTVGYSVSQDHTIRTWDIVTGQLVDTRSSSFALLSVTMLEKLSLLVCGSSGRHITLHDPRVDTSNTSSQTLNGHTNFVISLCPSPSSMYLFASGSYDGTTRIWDVRTTSPLFTIRRESGSPHKKVFDIDWRHLGLASAGEDKQLQINTVPDTTKI